MVKVRIVIYLNDCAKQHATQCCGAGGVVIELPPGAVITHYGSDSGS
jgi:hypothetical protein